MSYLNDTVSKYLDHAEDPEEEALNLLVWLQMRYDWAGVMFTRWDVETLIERKLTDEEWNKVTATKPWQDMHSIIIEAEGWEPVYMAIEEAKLDENDIGPDI